MSLPNKNIGIIGYGFVGSAQAHAFAIYNNKIYINDPRFPDRSKSKSEICLQCDVVFICVPTPMSTNGEGCFDSTILDNVVNDLYEIVKDWSVDRRPIFVLKSTMTPDYVLRIESLLGKVVYVPEFLREKYAMIDILNPSLLVIGSSSPELSNEVLSLHVDYSGIDMANVEVVKVSLVEASLIKYGINSFLATKVAWMNQYNNLVRSLGANWESVSKGLTADPRIGKTHTQVPGPDGTYGYGGTCFPKDVNAILRLADIKGVNFSILKEVDESNRKLRPDQY